MWRRFIKKVRGKRGIGNSHEPVVGRLEVQPESTRFNLDRIERIAIIPVPHFWGAGGLRGRVVILLDLQ